MINNLSGNLVVLGEVYDNIMRIGSIHQYSDSQREYLVTFFIDTDCRKGGFNGTNQCDVDRQCRFRR
jgi:hypothetical protein